MEKFEASFLGMLSEIVSLTLFMASIVVIGAIVFDVLR